MKSPIDELEESLGFHCVGRPIAEDEKAAQRWQEDRFAWLQAWIGTVSHIPENLRPMVQEATAQWQQIEQKVCARLGMDRDSFLETFTRLRDQFLKNNEGWESDVIMFRKSVYGAVRNMDWVNLFSWILPAADPEHAVAHRQIGQMVTAVFYMEILAKQCLYKSHADILMDSGIKNIDARWRLLAAKL